MPNLLFINVQQTTCSKKSENFWENMHVEALFGDVTALHASVLPEKEIYHTCFSQDIFEQLSCIT